jgi:isoleucyl-tRNA synthetase
MQAVREVVTASLELRQKSGHKVRQPLASLQVTGDFSKDFLDIIADEVNVKEIKVGAELKLDTTLTTELVKEGIARDVIRAIQDARKTEKLNPSETVKLVMNTNKRDIVEEFSEMIKGPTGVSEISFVDDKQTYSVEVEGGETTFSVMK